MKRDDVQLIRSTLSGNDEAFSTLVKKYQKSVHALAWRKIGDFHHAEEITQDTFLQAYKKLSTLKDPNQFTGWLYVIANRLCLNWMRKKKHATQSLESTRVEEVEKSSYTRYVSEQRETEASEHRSEIVKKLLARLPESERTVVTLYYLGEMTSKEIGKFLGVSVKTVHSRLHRARKRLQEKDELLVSEVLGGVQLPTNLIENVMQQVADMKPTGPPVAKPLLPWAAFGTAAVLVLLLFGVSNQYLIRYQKPYSFEAQSETIIEIIDAAVILDIDAKPAVRNQAGRAINPGKSSSTGLQSTETTLRSDTRADLAKFSTSQWTQTNGPHGGSVHNIFVTAERTLYAAARAGIYRREVDATAWTLINTEVPSNSFRMPMAELDDTLYIVSTDAIFASTDNGETWNVLCSRPEGHPVGLIVMNKIQGRNSDAGIVMYLALQDEGVLRSTNAGAKWDILKNGLVDERIYAMAAIGHTAFAGTNKNLYRLNSDVWQQLPVNTSGAVYWMTGFENNLYIGIHDFVLPEWGESKSTQKHVERITFDGNTKSNGIFHSTDLGASWSEITHDNKSQFMDPTIGTTFLANTGKTFLSQGVVPVDKNTFYRANPSGIHRTTNAGKSWHPFMNGITETNIQDLTAHNNRLYASTGISLVQSVDGGETWETIRIDSNNEILKVIGQEHSRLNLASELATANDTLYGIIPEYGISPEKDHLRLFQLTVEDDVLVPVPEAPTFEQQSSSVDLWTGDYLLNNREKSEKSDNLRNTTHFIGKHHSVGAFATSGQTFYVEWKRQLFKWKHGAPEWTDTGLMDNSEPLNGFDRGFKLAVSGETVYVGKRDGTLFQSLDSGDSWRDITPNLPLRFTHFKEIIFAGSRVYVATNEGVLISQSGEHWRVLTDGMGARTVIDQFAIHHTNVYGASDTGVYRLDTRGKWEPVSVNVPDKIVSLAAINDRLYVATQQRGVFHIPIEEEM